ncbi:MAG: twin-arginine translocase TatA/TatE family subunit [Devosiaceae bacterium]|nr:twin-arginine translocase TatA/TatE family subunit [Devosiaceae bacterium]
MNPGPWGILIIVVAVLLLFGRGKIAGMMGEVANGIKSFQKGLKDDPDKPMETIDATAKSEKDSETVKKDKDA